MTTFSRRLSPPLRGAVHVLLLAAVLVTVTACSAGRTSAPSAPGNGVPSEMDVFVDALLAEMTVTEKLGQLTQYSWGAATGPLAARGGDLPALYRQLTREGRVGSFLNVVGAEETRALQRLAVEESRLGIPLLFALDVIHGLRTEFPVPLAESCSWSAETVRRAARVAAAEAAASGLHWTFAPMVDVARDARWGRIVEGAGEDPYLGAILAAARVEGFQGDDLGDPATILACAKHFAAYGAAEGGRDYNTVDVSERTLRELYLPPFHAAVEAGVATFMTAFNEIGGIPATVSPWLFDEVLRQEWGFDGLVVSDWNAIAEVLAHGVGEGRTEVGALALRAGVDMDMMSDIFPELEPLVASGDVPVSAVDRAVRRVLEAKWKLGLFEDPYRYSDAARQERVVLSAEHLSAARDVARKSIVLLKNDGGVLPLSKRIGTLAVIGPLADDVDAPLGPWSATSRPEDVVDVLQGIREAVSPGTEVVHVKGADVAGADRGGFDDAVAAARRSDVAVLVLGERRDMSGEAASRAEVDLPGIQLELAQAVAATGTPVVAVLMNGRPLAIPWLAENVPAIVEAWYLGVQMGPAVADVLFGDYNPTGRLTVSFPRRTGQIPIHYNHKRTGRPPGEQKYTSKYLDLPSSPLYAFGHGLSYTTFTYDALSITPRQAAPDGTVTIRVAVENAGARAGTETVQLYLRDVAASVTRPVMELKGFQQVDLRPGERREVVFEVPVALLGFYDASFDFVVEPGRVDVMVGRSAGDVRLEGSFEVVGDVTRVADVPRRTSSHVLD